MKTAISASGDSKESLMDKRFGRCPYFCIYDDESKGYSFHKNPGFEAQEGAGPVAVQFLVNEGVQKIVAAEFGGKVKPVLEQLQIQMIMMQGDRTIEDLINQLKK
ncbi:MAG: diguanylate cyclase [Marinilabiliales bacterium]|mgnify:CR=1 FL=1|nr:MAG: diguanylate cyclase [Marinilabiliales bacterium]